MIFGLIKGIQSIEISGAMPEQFINACAKMGIELWELRRLDACTVSASAWEKQMKDIDKLAAKCSCEIKLIKLRGGSSYRNRLRRRRTGIICAVTSMLLLLVSGLFVWEVELQGCEKLGRGAVMRALEECGLCRGSYWPALSQDALRSRMMEKLPQIAWMTVNVEGSRAKVYIRERSEKPEIYKDSSPVDIVALRTGIVRELSVLGGTALVREGQCVLEGDVLISCSREGGGIHRAMGSVQADTWREMSAVTPLLTEKSAGRLSYSRFALKIGNYRINFYINSGKGVDGCDKIIKEYKIGIEGLFMLPVSLVQEKLCFYKSGDELVDGGAEAERLKAGLYELLESQTEGKIVFCAFSESGSDELCSVSLRAQCLENIALEMHRPAA